MLPINTGVLCLPVFISFHLIDQFYRMRPAAVAVVERFVFVFGNGM